MRKTEYFKLAVLVSVVLTVFFVSLFLNIKSPSKTEPEDTIASNRLEIGTADKVALTIVYDNNPYDEQIKTAWGFGCYINVDGVRILFDTGGDPEILLDNMAKLDIDVGEIEIIVLSHIHGDHVGGLFGVLEMNSQVKIYLPASFPDNFKRRVEDYECEIVEVKDALKICNGVATTGELGITIKEQSLIVTTTKGLIVITGCAHPGVVNVVKEAKQLTDMEVYLVLGGFHLVGASENTILSIIEHFREYSVMKVAPCHCSGDPARELFKQEFGGDYIEVGVGSDLQVPLKLDCRYFCSSGSLLFS